MRKIINRVEDNSWRIVGNYECCLISGPIDNGSYHKVRVSSMHRNKVPCKTVKASQCATLQLEGVDFCLRKGMVLLGLTKPLIATWFFQVTSEKAYSNAYKCT